MAYNFNGKILRINLSNNDIYVEMPKESLYRKYLGGRALSLYYLLSELEPGIDPLSEDNILIFMCSVVTGRFIPGFNRYSVVSKSPLTNAYAESEAGGIWGPNLNAAGYDGIIIKGKAKKPIFLWIHNNKVELKDATEIWGKTTGDTVLEIKKKLDCKGVSVASIGPAGEKLVLFANINNDLRFFNGRCGLGAVMGSKNLKAIAVKGEKKLDVFDKDLLKSAVSFFIKKSGAGYETLREFGRLGGLLGLNSLNALPTKNFNYGRFQGAENISAIELNKTLLIGRDSCPGCPIRCKRVVSSSKVYEIDKKYGGPEYESIAALGSLCGIDNIHAITKGNELCNRYGLDTISTGVVIAFMMECFEKGLLKNKDVNGVDFRFGNEKAMLETIKLIAYKEGIGKTLAKGVKIAAKWIGKSSEKYALHVKGLEIPMHEPRIKQNMALAYSLSPTGADHLQSIDDINFAGKGESLNRLNSLGILEPIPLGGLSIKKVRVFIYFQFLMSLYNCLGICYDCVTPYGFLPLHKISDCVIGLTGWDTSLWELLKVGERGINMARVFNIREGFTEEDDNLPDKFFNPIGSIDGNKGEMIKKNEFELAKKDYYSLMGWDKLSGVPLKEKLEELDLGWLQQAIKNTN